ncbi:MAG TPA: hypothetical protein VMU42_03265 [Candidatus Sulfotelmatobacter sp.]|nr:hypothetical protein [Candidatus Sulfotelmatobacter sp.]
MGATADHYRNEAERARRWSAEISDAELRHRILILADIFGELADQIDGLKHPELNDLLALDKPPDE